MRKRNKNAKIQTSGCLAATAIVVAVDNVCCCHSLFALRIIVYSLWVLLFVAIILYKNLSYDLICFSLNHFERVHSTRVQVVAVSFSYLNVDENATSWINSFASIRGSETIASFSFNDKFFFFRTRSGQTKSKNNRTDNDDGDNEEEEYERQLASNQRALMRSFLYNWLKLLENDFISPFILRSGRPRFIPFNDDSLRFSGRLTIIQLFRQFSSVAMVCFVSSNDATTKATADTRTEDENRQVEIRCHVRILSPRGNWWDSFDQNWKSENIFGRIIWRKQSQRQNASIVLFLRSFVLLLFSSLIVWQLHVHFQFRVLSLIFRFVFAFFRPIKLQQNERLLHSFLFCWFLSVAVAVAAVEIDSWILLRTMVKVKA